MSDDELTEFSPTHPENYDQQDDNMRFAEVRATCATPIKNDFRPMDSQRCKL